MYKKTILGIYLLLVIFLTACISPVNRHLDKTLSLAGENREELEKVLSYYASDSLKLAAARFLIMNMPYHFSNEEYFLSPQGEKYRPDISRFRDYKAVESYCDSLIKSGYRINKEKVYDILSINSHFLIDNIELAFEVWKKPWARNIPFEDFCRYILPYRAQTEMPSRLRKEIMERFIPILDSAKVVTSLEACCILNEYLKGVMKYRKTGLPFYPTLEETYTSEVSQCEGLCNLGTFIMRACGIPVAVHQTTWTRMDLAHNWCAVLHEGKFYDFNPGDIQPEVYRHTLATTRYLQPAKVYRRHFDADLSVLPSDDDGYITQLKNPLFTDVTEEQEMQTYSLRIPTNRNVHSNNQLVYLCVYNYYQWQPIAIGKRDRDTCCFTHVAGKNIFIVAEATGKHDLSYISAPIYTDRDGSFHMLTPDIEHLISQTFQREAGENPKILYYWNCKKQEFSRLEYVSLTDSTQFYNNIPDNALLWYTLDRKAIGQRVGIIVDGEFKKNYEL